MEKPLVAFKKSTTVFIKMKKDYIDTTNLNLNEISFVENHWTKKWDDLGLITKTSSKVFSCEEYRIIACKLKELASGAKIFDGGCGLGEWVLALNQKGFQVTGMDVSKKTIQLLRERYPETNFIYGDIRHTTFPDETFDAYFSWGVFEHFENGPQNCIQEAYRILKPGGMLFISVPFDNIRHALLGSWGGWKGNCDNVSQRFYQWRFTKSELSKELRLAGFNVLDIKALHNRSGILRCLQNDFKMTYNSTISRAIAYVLAPVIPRFFIAHMILATSQKPTV